MKKLFLPFLTVFALGFVTSCSDDPTPEPEEEGDELTKSGIITANETWTANNVYILDGKVIVNEGVTLTIEPGTIIKGEEGQESLASALVIDQGGRLLANGTADRPIIFTSVLDNIQAGQTAGTNLTTEDTGLWGGVIVLGRAPISVSGDNLTKQIEGIPVSEPYGQYGGDDPEDDSGSLQYISIRHGGITIGQDNEINGLTLGGVGSGTTVNHIEVIANQDDGIEWFGGTVDASNLLVWSPGDDGLDADEAYSGTVDNALIIMNPATGADNAAFELDGPAGSAATEDGFTFQNITIIGAGTAGRYADLRDGLIANLNNILAYGLGADATVRVNGADSQTEFANGRITFSDWEIVLPEGATVAGILADAPAGSEANFTDNVAAIASPEEATVGANTSVFSWTYAEAEGAY